MNLPNKLTISRIALTMAFIFFVLTKGLSAKVWALAVFSLASLTDVLDGYLAKRTNSVTDFGKLMDPIADKILVLSAFLSFVQLGIIPAWMVIIILFRELAITGLRGLALAKGRVIPADDGGKHKTVSQIVAIFAILIFIIFKDAGRLAPFAANVIFGLMLITTALTLISGTSYMLKNKEVYLNAKTD